MKNQQSERSLELIVAKRGPRLKPAIPGAPLPIGMNLTSGGVMTGIGPTGADGWNFHAATMQDLAGMMLGLYFDDLLYLFR